MSMSKRDARVNEPVSRRSKRSKKAPMRFRPGGDADTPSSIDNMIHEIALQATAKSDVPFAPDAVVALEHALEPAMQVRMRLASACLSLRLVSCLLPVGFSCSSIGACPKQRYALISLFCVVYFFASGKHVVDEKDFEAVLKFYEGHRKKKNKAAKK